MKTKLPAVGLMALALLIAGVAWFENCQVHDGAYMMLANGMKASMKCYWSAVVSIVIATPLLATGGMQFFSRSAETQRALAVVGALLGAFVILVPTTLIGVCANPEHICNLVMKPALIFMGTLVIGLDLLNLWVTRPQAMVQAS